MSESSDPRVPAAAPVAADRSVARADSHLTLHYRLSLADGGTDIVNTFEGKPATLQLGIGQMAEPLEQQLIGLAEGDHVVLDLPAGVAFGARSPELVQRVSAALLRKGSEPGIRYVPGDVVEFNAPAGGRFAGVVKMVDERGTVVDFNHPLAGQPVRFEVRILGIL